MSVGLRIITANRLIDGAPVYRTSDGEWSDTILEAALYQGEAGDAAMAQALAEETTIVGPYFVDMDGPGIVGHRHRVREHIRAGGPTAGSDTRAETA